MWAACQYARRENFCFYYVVEGSGLCKSALSVFKSLFINKNYMDNEFFRHCS